MKRYTMIGTIALTLIAAAGLGLWPNAPAPVAAAPTAAAENFKIDTVHSSVIFKVEHMGVANFYGRFNNIEGTYAIDPSNLGASSFDIKVKTESVDTKNQKRDDHLRSGDFFNATEFPEITFKSTKAEVGPKSLNVTGDLTLHGVTKPVTVQMKLFPTKDTRQGPKGGFETTFTIKRTDFEMDTYVAEGGLGDEIQITVAVEGAKS